jgi:hypothetical protein
LSRLPRNARSPKRCAPAIGSPLTASHATRHGRHGRGQDRLTHGHQLSTLATNTIQAGEPARTLRFARGPADLSPPKNSTADCGAVGGPGQAARLERRMDAARPKPGGPGQDQSASLDPKGIGADHPGLSRS